MNNLHVLFVLPTDKLGGAEQLLWQIARYHQLNCDHIYIMVLSSPKNDHWLEISLESRIVYIPNVKAFLSRQFRDCMRRMFDRVYLSHTKVLGLVGLLSYLGLLHYRKLISRESTMIFDRFSGLKLVAYQFCYKLGVPKISLNICQTTEMKVQLLKAWKSIGVHAPVEVIANPIDAKFLNTRDLVRPQDVPRSYLIAVGRLIQEKGYDILMEAFANLLLEGWEDLSLVILGEGRELASLKELALSLGIHERVYFLGFKEDIIPYLRYAEACVVSSRIEGFPNVLLQMMAQNERVVSTLCAGDIDKLRGVFTCLPSDVKSLTQAIQRALLYSETSSFRRNFDEELSKRSIDAYMKQINVIIGNE